MLMHREEKTMSNFIVLSKEENELIEEVRELASTKIAERGIHIDSIGDSKPDWLIPELLEKRNLLEPLLPKEYGGRGLSMLATTRVIEELAAGCAGSAAVVVMNSYAITPIIIAGSEELKTQFLSKKASERPHLACMAVSETNPEYDLERSEHPREDITRISTTASLEGDKIIINGTKDFVMNGGLADFIVVLARSRESKQKSRLQLYLVPSDTPGVEIIRTLNKVGMRSCHTVQLKFNNVCIPREYHIGSRGGYLLLIQTFDYNLPLIGAMGVGVARAAYQLALDVARTTKMLDRNSQNYKLVTSILVDMTTRIDAARLAVMRAAYYIDIDENYSRVATMAKLYATKVAQEVSSQAVDIIGHYGFITGHPAEKYMRDAQMLSIISGSDHLHKQILSQQL